MRAFTIIFGLSLLVASFPCFSRAQWPLGGDPTKKGDSRHYSTSITMTGRFQIFVSPNIKSATFMLDTDTGRVWIMKKDHKTGAHFLKRVPADEIDKKSDSIKAEDKSE